MNFDSYDVAVLGAGPAGSAAALAAAQTGARVLLCDPRREPVDTPCGEGMMPEGAAVLRALGLGALVDAAQNFDGIEFVTPHGRRLRAPLPGGKAVARPLLQGALDAVIAADARIARVFARGRAQRRDDGKGYDVGVDGRVVRAATVVAAAGLAASDLPLPAARGRTRPGLRARCATGSRALDGVEVHLGRGCEIYLTPLKGGVVTAAVLWGPDAPAGDAARLYAEALARHPHAQDALGTPLTPPAARVVAHRAPPRLAADGCFLAGDCGLAVDPIVGCGVTLALVGGRRAGLSAAAVAAGADPAKAARGYDRAMRRLARPRSRLADFLRFLSAHDGAAEAAAATLGRLPRLLAWLAARAAGAAAHAA